MVDLLLAILRLSRTQNSSVRPQNAKYLSIAKTAFYLNYQMFYHTLTNRFILVGGPTFYNPVLIFQKLNTSSFRYQVIPTNLSYGMIFIMIEQVYF